MSAIITWLAIAVCLAAIGSVIVCGAAALFSPFLIFPLLRSRPRDPYSGSEEMSRDLQEAEDLLRRTREPESPLHRLVLAEQRLRHTHGRR